MSVDKLAPVLLVPVLTGFLSPTGSCGHASAATSTPESAPSLPARVEPADDLACARAHVLLDEARAAKERNDPAAARAKAAEAIELLLSDGDGKDSDARIRLISTLGTFAFDVGDLRSSERAQRRAVEVYSRTLKDDHPDLQAARSNLAIRLKTLGDLAGARSLELKVLEVFSQTLPDDHPSLQRARGNFATTLYMLGDLAGARSVLEKLIEVRLRTLPDDDPDLQLTRATLAATLAGLGDLGRARSLFEKVLEIDSRRLSDDHPDLQRTRLNLGSTLYLLGDLAGARSLFEKVLEVRLRTLPDDHPDLQKARGNLATTILSLGDSAGARPLQEKVLEVLSRELPDDNPDLQKARQNFAITLATLGDVAGARPLFEKVLEVSSRSLPGDHPDLQDARLNFANMLYKLGDLAGARELEEIVLEVLARTLPEDHPDLQSARLSLADTLYNLGDLEGARSLQENVLEVCSRTLPDDNFDLQKTRRKIAVALAAERIEERKGTADAEAERAKETIREKFAALVSDYVQGVRHAALQAVLGASGREAEERIASGGDLSHALSLARGYGAFDSDPALEEQVFLLSESTRNVALLSARLARAAHSDATWKESQNRLRASADRLAALGQSGGESKEFGAARSQLEKTQSELVHIGSKLDPEAIAALQPSLSAISSRLKEREALITYRRYTRLELDEHGTETSTESLCAFVVRSGSKLARIELGPIEAIERAIQDWTIAAGLGNSASPSRGVPTAPTTARSSEEQGEGVRTRIFDPLRPALAGVERVSVALDDVLHLVPLEALPDRSSTDPSDKFDSAGFALRAVPELLGDHLRIEYCTSLLAVLMQPSALNVEPRLLVMGDADYGGEQLKGAAAEASALQEDGPSPTRGSEQAGILRGGSWEAGFAPLPATREEGRGIETLFGLTFGDRATSELFIGRRASREELVANASKARFIHLAVHGWFAPDSIRSIADCEPIDARMNFGLHSGLEERVKGMSPMLLCGLALAGANLPKNELGRIPGLITAEEIGALDLSNCELAVLSACDTNVGLRRAGQGVASLQKALHTAGARSVITSLWKVPDEATKDLMLDFYRRLWVEKQPKWQALWEAKRMLRDAKDPKGEAKYTLRDWAGWMLSGDPN